MLTVFGFGFAICLQFLVRQIGPSPTPGCKNASALTNGAEVQWNGKPG
jgi:hypothetical protein